MKSRTTATTYLHLEQLCDVVVELCDIRVVLTKSFHSNAHGLLVESTGRLVVTLALEGLSKVSQNEGDSNMSLSEFVLVNLAGFTKHSESLVIATQRRINKGKVVVRLGH